MRKGSHHSEESKLKLSLATKGRTGTWTGKKHSEETKNKLKVAWIKRRKLGVSEETRKKVSLSLKGNKRSYKGGRTPKDVSIRMSIEYKLWRTAVFTRDGFTCVWCSKGNKNGEKTKLNADHIKPFSKYPELRFNLDNGRTLCVPCHRKTDTYGYKARYA